MNLRLSMVFRPSSLAALLTIAALIVVFSLTPCWYSMVKHIERRVKSNPENFLSDLRSEIEHSAQLLRPMNSSSTNLARLLSSILNATNISFSQIETKVAPVLFQAFTTVPHLAEISYIGMEGLFFSYYTDHNQTLALYSSSPSAASQYYVQPVNRDSGELYGEAIIAKPSIDPSWILEATNGSYGFASLGTMWSNGQYPLFLSSAKITSTAVASLGFATTAITDFITRISSQGASLHLATKDGKVLVQGIQHTNMVFSDDMVLFQSVSPDHSVTYEGTVSCKDEDIASALNIRDTKYLLSCSPIEIMGLELVYVLAVPQNGLVSFVHKCRKHGVELMSIMMVLTVISILSFLFMYARAAMREMHLCASLIKQMEATQQAERKSMNKSLAFASASHDVRASLAGLTGLIEMSYEEVVPGSELETNLKQMDACTKDLIELLNSILDTSKIEAGKMELAEEEFDLPQLLEDVVDLYYPAAMKKGVDLVWDPCNGSVLRYSYVKGDRGKLKQILCNLLSNAVKFTNEGHITVRAWAQKPSFQNSVIANSNSYTFLKSLSCLCYKKNEAHNDEEAMNPIQQDLNCMDFVFEVDDTGQGIPKEKHKYVFENYVQVKETALGQGGTGLGLGIVQSLVRLMHGDIGIVDKEIGEKGTCFRFNVLLTASETLLLSASTRENAHPGSDRNQAQGPAIHIATSGSSICSVSPRLPPIRSSSPRPEGSRVVLLIQDEERRRTTQKFMESLGVKVQVVKKWEHLFYALKKIKSKGRLPSQSSPVPSDLSSRSTSQNSFAGAKEIPLSAMDGTDYLPSIFKMTDIGAAPGFVLLVIDAHAGPFSELCRMVSNFRRGLRNPCKVVWLDKPLMRNINFKELGEDVFDQNDILITKPFHGTRLFQVIRFLPEYGGAWQSSSSRGKRENTNYDRVGKASMNSDLSKRHSPVWNRTETSPTDGSQFHGVELQDDSSSRGEQIRKETQIPVGGSKARKSPAHGVELQECGDTSPDKLLSGKRFLIVEDNRLLRKLASSTLIRLGASVEQCENGVEAAKLVEEGLSGAFHGFPKIPYDYILMDCEMPVMNGFEATRRIRKIEKPYGIRIPIIALTAHTSGNEVNMTIEAGMDVHLGKPIRKEHLLEAIRYIHSM